MWKQFNLITIDPSVCDHHKLIALKKVAPFSEAPRSWRIYKSLLALLANFLLQFAAIMHDVSVCVLISPIRNARRRLFASNFCAYAAFYCKKFVSFKLSLKKKETFCHCGTFFAANNLINTFDIYKTGMYTKVKFASWGV